MLLLTKHQKTYFGRILRIQSEAVTIANTTCTTFSLLCSCLADRSDDQTIHSSAGIVTVLLAHASIDHIAYSVNRD